MDISAKSRKKLRLQGIVFVVLFSTIIGLLAWLSHQYSYQADWTVNNRNTLSNTTIKLLEKIQGPVTITAFMPETEQQDDKLYIQNLVNKYKRYKQDFTLEFINPDIALDKVKQMNVTRYGEIVVQFQGRSEITIQFNEKVLTNILQRLLRGGKRQLLFVSGHGERRPDGNANFDWSVFSEKLESKGISSELLKLNETPEIPEASALIIASPQVDFLPGETKLIIDYINKGGNLLWVQEPGASLHGLNSLAQIFGIQFVPGTIVDPTTQELNLKNPTFAIISSYPQHAITRDFQFRSLFPEAVGIDITGVVAGWKAAPFLQTVPRSWSETSALKGELAFNSTQDIAGPLTIGVALTRTETKTQARKQRVIILGDGDFLSNSFLGNGGNLNIGYNVINWLTHDDTFIDIPSNDAPDKQIQLSEMLGAVIGLFFFILLPLGLLVAGILIWFKRRKY